MASAGHLARRCGLPLALLVALSDWWKGIDNLPLCSADQRLHFAKVRGRWIARRAIAQLQRLRKRVYCIPEPILVLPPIPLVTYGDTDEKLRPLERRAIVQAAARIHAYPNLTSRAH